MANLERDTIRYAFADTRLGQILVATSGAVLGAGLGMLVRPLTMAPRFLPSRPAGSRRI